MLYYKVKAKFSSVCGMDAYMGSRGTAPPILNFGAKRWHVVNFTSQLLYNRERNLAPAEDETG